MPSAHMDTLCLSTKNKFVRLKPSANLQILISTHFSPLTLCTSWLLGSHAVLLLLETLMELFSMAAILILNSLGTNILLPCIILSCYSDFLDILLI